MKPVRALLAAVLLAAGTVAGAGGEMPAGKRVAPPAVAPLTLHGVRYEAPPDTRDFGDDQAGGYLVARDARSGRELWRQRIYVTAYDPKLESDVQDVFIASLRAGRGGRTLEITDERGRRYTLDLSSRAVQEQGVRNRR